jgi:hypothetical protein
MKDNDDELFLHEIEFAVENASDSLLDSLTKQIFAASSRLNQIRPIIRDRKITDAEGQYLQLEVHRLYCELEELHEIYKNLHNWSIEAVFNSNRSDYGDFF